jgi:hypothetical protein
MPSLQQHDKGTQKGKSWKEENVFFLVGLKINTRDKEPLLATQKIAAPMLEIIQR